jgi:hypothetical protein
MRWWQYHEADTYAGKIDIAGADGHKASFTVPAEATPGDTIHLIFDAKDAGRLRSPATGASSSPSAGTARAGRRTGTADTDAGQHGKARRVGPGAPAMRRRVCSRREAVWVQLLNRSRDTVGTYSQQSMQAEVTRFLLQSRIIHGPGRIRTSV